MEQQPYIEDTISLIDLLAVVVRHRRLIIGGTLVVLIIAVLVMYLGPTFGLPVGPQTTYAAEQKIAIIPLPESVAEYLTFDPVALVTSVVTSPRYIGEHYRPIAGPNAGSAESYLSDVRSRVIGGPFTTSFDATTGILTLTFTSGTSGQAGAFLERVRDGLSAEITQQLAAQLSQASDAVESAIADTNEALARVAARELAGASVGQLSAFLSVNAVTVSELARLAHAQSIIAQVSEGGEVFFSPMGEVVAYQETSGNQSMVVVIASITAFFLTVFLAFVLEYIRRVRQDPEEMKKLADAWKGK